MNQCSENYTRVRDAQKNAISNFYDSKFLGVNAFVTKEYLLVALGIKGVYRSQLPFVHPEYMAWEDKDYIVGELIFPIEKSKGFNTTSTKAELLQEFKRRYQGLKVKEKTTHKEKVYIEQPETQSNDGQEAFSNTILILIALTTIAVVIGTFFK